MKTLKKVLSACVGGAGLLALAGGLNQAVAIALSCGMTIGPNAGTVVAANNLNCNSGTAITIVGPKTTLDLDGHYVQCFVPLSIGTADYAVVLSGQKAGLKNGRVSGCLVAGVSLAGTGGHRVDNITSDLNEDSGIITISDHNKITHCSARGNTAAGFVLLAYTAPRLVGNTLADNTAFQNAVGFEVVNTAKTVMKRNVAVANTQEGFSIGGSTGGGHENNKLIQNVAARNGADGFEITALRTTVRSNVAIGNDSNGGAYPASGFYLSSGLADNCVLTKNLAQGNEADGFRVEGDDNKLNKNQAFANGSNGIYMDPSALRNTITGNTALGYGSGTDLSENAACATNVWKKNTSNSINDSCIN